jgi:hypothetical protein
MPAEIAPLVPQMPLGERLDRCRSEVAGCELVAYGDLGSGLILRSSSHQPCPRERLDALCDAAAVQLRGARCQQLAGQSGAPPRLAVTMTRDETRIFVATGVAGTAEYDMLCSVSDGRADVTAGIRALSRALRDVTDV